MSQRKRLLFFLQLDCCPTKKKCVLDTQVNEDFSSFFKVINKILWRLNNREEEEEEEERWWRWWISAPRCSFSARPRRFFPRRAPSPGSSRFSPWLFFLFCDFIYKERIEWRFSARAWRLSIGLDTRWRNWQEESRRRNKWGKSWMRSRVRMGFSWRCFPWYLLFIRDR